MVEPLPEAGRPGKIRRSFATTHWSLVRAVGGTESPETATALETLCQIYWHPVYSHIRLWGSKPEDAQDLTQAFFARLLEKKAFDHADPERGRFRSFMLGSLKHFLRDTHIRANAEKRGGGRTIVSWDRKTGEARLGIAPADNESPDRIFERRWAETVLERAATRLRSDYESSGRGALFEVIKPHVTPGPNHKTIADTAAALDSSISATRSAIFRLRRHYHALIRDEVAQTLDDPAELDDELRYLLKVLYPSSQMDEPNQRRGNAADLLR